MNKKREGKTGILENIKSIFPYSNLTREERKLLADDKRKLSGKGSKRPTTAQKTISFEKMYQDGICLVKPGFYTKMVEFFDINYDLLEDEDKYAILDHVSDQ